MAVGTARLTAETPPPGQWQIQGKERWQGSLPVVVKNTFLHLEEDEAVETSAPRRRCASAPAARRSWREGGFGRGKEETMGVDGWSEASTDFTDVDIATGTPVHHTSFIEAGTPPPVEEKRRPCASGVGHGGGLSQLNPMAPVWTPGPSGAYTAPPTPLGGAAVAPWTLAPSSPPSSPAAVAQGSGADTCGGVPLPDAEDLSQYRSQRLNSRAKAWTPRPPAGTTQQGARQFGGLVAVVKQDLEDCAPVVGLETGEGSQGWSLMVQIHQEDFLHKERLLNMAKESLLRAAEQSRNVYVMGYCSRPFANTELGFAARLGIMRDENRACWDIFKQGFCCREGSCRWQHPVSQTGLVVSVQIVGRE
mmetsp:Transcript_65131/g.139510  ORF Transcript_65131/g.139510 Transcript_65131/m.139510 type:complete len:363 (-) Transcript_65131:136-1224(-)